jgi:hypothetical protein
LRASWKAKKLRGNTSVTRVLHYNERGGTARILRASPRGAPPATPSLPDAAPISHL